ncbi:threonine synthase [Elizabethkingia anophelis]|uniref:Threonine synthase n=1 Tax=Elizabethkingia anophelis TaxID=1117645 RepID=A0AAE4P1Z6_9FLAO|nr:threonine synthase [Elizabethkingia anophelis]MCT3662290.1 threonine synthase [Elizabethkingia anophelis]MCT3801926.1 threonine synthase [Elizabethkingia anophelis]MCT3906018.1 threonine synthase [Elizabethkingia anophelis]MCT3918236.1 threonine synthase [Elizabethkingia anophelis]MCT3950601.1 threonine synthase [Elizabethkingia anophelis]
MKYYSTRGKHSVNIQQAVLNGLADDGGLYMPAYIPQLSASFFENIEKKTLPEIGFEVAKLFLEDSVPDAVLKQMIDEVLNFDIPVVPVHHNIYSLELFHGPTLAFKDVGARFMARLMSYFAEGKPMKVIAATSGDTGSAVAAGFYNVPGINVYILYPKGKVSPLQEKQLTTWGGNIKALEIEGTFDDCQALAKRLLADEELQQHQVTSANSINIARLIPQSFYYFWAYAQLKNENKKIVFSVPSGNFGNLTAGLLAYKMGLPVNRFIASTNINNVVPQYLKTGTYEAKASLSTVSNAMDVGNPSNFERMKDLFQEDVTKFREIISGYYFIDEETKATVQEVYKESGYLLDPHGAVAYLGLVQYQKEQQQDFNGVLLETAHPAKFIETVEESISEKIEIPEKLSAFGKKEKVATLFPVDFQLIKAFIKQY